MGSYSSLITVFTLLPGGQFPLWIEHTGKLLGGEVHHQAEPVTVFRRHTHKISRHNPGEKIVAKTKKI